MKADSQFKVYKVTIGQPSIRRQLNVNVQPTLCFVRPRLVELFVTPLNFAESFEVLHFITMATNLTSVLNRYYKTPDFG